MYVQKAIQAGASDCATAAASRFPVTPPSALPSPTRRQLLCPNTAPCSPASSVRAVAVPPPVAQMAACAVVCFHCDHRQPYDVLAVLKMTLDAMRGSGGAEGDSRPTAAGRERRLFGFRISSICVIVFHFRVVADKPGICEPPKGALSPRGISDKDLPRAANVIKKLKTGLRRASAAGRRWRRQPTQLTFQSKNPVS